MKKLLNTLGVTVAAITLIVTLPVTLPYLAITQARRDSRLRKCALKTECEECGNLLGEESLRLSSKVWEQYVRDFRDKHPGVRFRIVRPHDSICPNCNAQYRYDDNNCVLIRIAAEELVGV